MCVGGRGLVEAAVTLGHLFCRRGRKAGHILQVFSPSFVRRFIGLFKY
jgi:hypothetical protein